jgi:hypothetical protein
MRNSLRRLLARHRAFLVSCAVVLAGFQLLICAIVASIDVGTAMEQMLAFVPPVMRSMIEQSMLGHRRACSRSDGTIRSRTR